MRVHTVQTEEYHKIVEDRVRYHFSAVHAEGFSAVHAEGFGVSTQDTDAGWRFEGRSKKNTVRFETHMSPDSSKPDM